MVDAAGENVKLTLDGVNLERTAADDVPALGVEAAASVTVTVAAGSENTLAGGPNAAALQNKEIPLTINGAGQLTAIARDSGAGIGGGCDTAGRNITITGDVKVNASSAGGPGIGGSRSTDAENITITGNAEVTAIGKGAAGIGTGSSSNVSNILISGHAMVTAKGNSGSAAGIGNGSGTGTASLDLTITENATVIATGSGENPAIGIGGNSGSSSKNILINIEGNAIVNAVASNAAAIGKGNWVTSTPLTIKISGNSKVYAEGNGQESQKSGLGGGNTDDEVQINISGGHVIQKNTYSGYWAMPKTATITAVNYNWRVSPTEAFIYNETTPYDIASDRSVYSEVICGEDKAVVYHEGTAESGLAPTTHIADASGDIVLKGNDGKLKKQGYKLVRWNTQENLLGTPYNVGDTLSGVSGVVNLYPEFEKYTCYLRYHKNDGGGADETDTSVGAYYDVAQAAADGSAFTREGYVFKYWNTKADGSGEIVLPGESMKEFAPDPENPYFELYAQWRDASEGGCFLEFEANGGTDVTTVIRENGAVLKLSYYETEKAGYEFAGWYLDRKLTSPAPATYTLTGDTVLFAKWTVRTPQTYNFKWDIANGYSGAPTYKNGVQIYENDILKPDQDAAAGVVEALKIDTDLDGEFDDLIISSSYVVPKDLDGKTLVLINSDIAQFEGSSRYKVNLYLQLLDNPLTQPIDISETQAPLYATYPTLTPYYPYCSVDNQQTFSIKQGPYYLVRYGWPVTGTVEAPNVININKNAKIVETGAEYADNGYTIINLAGEILGGTFKQDIKMSDKAKILGGTFEGSISMVDEDGVATIKNANLSGGAISLAKAAEVTIQKTTVSSIVNLQENASLVLENSKVTEDLTVATGSAVSLKNTTVTNITNNGVLHVDGSSTITSVTGAGIVVIPDTKTKEEYPGISPASIRFEAEQKIYDAVENAPIASGEVAAGEVAIISAPNFADGTYTWEVCTDAAIGYVVIEGQTGPNLNIGTAAAIDFDNNYKCTITINGHSVSFDGIKITKKVVRSGGGKAKIEEPVPEVPALEPVDVAALSDIQPGAWYYSAVKAICERGLMRGTSDNFFDAKGKTSRAMVLTILYRLDGEKKAEGKTTFADVQPGSWYEDATVWADTMGIAHGYSGVQFAPNADMTREQLAVVLYNYAKFKGLDLSKTANTADFADNGTVHDYAKDAIAWAYANGIITGIDAVSDGKVVRNLDPIGSTQRCQLAVMLERFIEKYDL